jgi:ribonuclease HI
MKKRKPKSAYYVIWKGRVPGIYNSWAQAKDKLGHRYPGAQFLGVTSKEEAEFALTMPYEEYRKQYHSKGIKGTAKKNTPLF